MKIQESGEMYFETILILNRRLGNVRSVDIATEMGFSKPTVSVALKNFRENGYVKVDADGFVTLTKAGEEIAEKIYDRHLTISKFLMNMGVSEDTALKDACKMEHDLSDETFNIMKTKIAE